MGSMVRFVLCGRSFTLGKNKIRTGAYYIFYDNERV